VYKYRNGESEDPTQNSQFSDGRVGWRKWAIRAQETLHHWEFDENGEILGMWQQAPPKYTLDYIPIEKALLFRSTVRKGNPEGRSILRNAYTSWYAKNNIQRIEAIGIERDLVGVPVAWVPQELLAVNATADEKSMLTRFEQMVTRLRRDNQEGIVMPNVYDEGGHRVFDLSLLTSGGARQFNIDPIIVRYDQRMAMSVMADFILLGQENVGSFALSENKSDMFATALVSWADAICAVSNRFGIPRLLKLNGYDTSKGRPTMEHGDVQSEDLDKLSNFILRLSQAGASLFPSVPLEKRLLQVANLPVPTDEELATQHTSPAASIPDQEAPPEPLGTPSVALGAAGAPQFQVVGR
jgi:hypothetical protein